MCVALPSAAAPALREHLRPDDLVLLLRAAGDEDSSRDSAARFGLASVDHVCLGSTQGAHPAGRWCFRVPDTEVERGRGAADAAWDRARLPTIDWLARRITGREIGVALGVGVARKAMGSTTFAEFQRPTAVVAADLVKGDRFVFEEGSGRVAMLATSAIPGIFPPESYDGRLLVDGGLVSRIPVDLLERRRCGLKIAVNVVPSPAHKEDDYARLSGTFDRFFGLTNVIASSWGLLAWWHGAGEGRQADILVESQRGRRTRRRQTSASNSSSTSSTTV